MNPTKPKIILVHGIGRTKAMFTNMANYFAEQGYDVCNFGYPSRHFPIKILAERFLGEVLNANKDQAILHYVGHSLGCILLRYYLQHYSLPNLGRSVFIGPPNHGSEVAESLKSWWFYKWYMGPAGQQLGVGVESVPKQLNQFPAEFGVIAGTTPSRLFSRFIPGPNDGKVSVESTQLTGMRDFITINDSHAGLVRNPQVMEQARYFIEHGLFMR